MEIEEDLVEQEVFVAVEIDLERVVEKWGQEVWGYC